MNDRYSMIRDIAEGIEDTEMLNKMRLCYFRGLLHGDDSKRTRVRAEILDKEIGREIQRLKREYPHD